MKCPKCGNLNDDNWPLNIGGNIYWGGCTECWEVQADEEWWNIVVFVEDQCVEAGG